MLQYLIKRLLLLIVTLFGIMVITFVLTRLTPGDPAAARVQGARGAAQAVGGYDELIERSRRNLGLDKPLLINLRFDDRQSMAHMAIDDFFRRGEFWRRDGERRLARMSTIALAPALQRYPVIGTEDEPQVRDSSGRLVELAPAEERRERLAELLSRLAAEPPRFPEGASPDVRFEYWRDWYEKNQVRYEEQRVESLVEDFLRADNARASELQAEVFRAGGFTVPHLIDALHTNDLEVILRVNRALQTQTGFTFVTSEERFAEQAETVVARWRSWWRREHMNYSDPGPFGHAFNTFFNTQFGLWMLQAISFDFGDSYARNRPVSDLINQALPVSLLLAGLSIFFSYLIAIPLGIFSAIQRHTNTDTVITVILFILYSLPSFWVAGLLLLTTTGPPFLTLFSTRGFGSVDLEPGTSWWSVFIDRVWHLVLPVTCLTYGSLAFISRQMRSALLETINQDFIRTARAKGLNWRSVIFKHALRNSLIPIITISAGILPELIAGAVIIESIFSIPGMGTLTFESIVNRDYPVINAVLFISAFLTLLGILIADLMYAVVDPRISYD